VESNADVFTPAYGRGVPVLDGLIRGRYQLSSFMSGNQQKIDSMHIRCTDTDAGGCDFTISVGDVNQSCRASYLGSHPACRLMQIAVDAHQHYFYNPYPLGKAHLQLIVEDEPGGIELNFDLLNDRVLGLCIKQYTEGTLRPGPDQLITSPYYRGFITFANLLEEAYRVGAELLQECGIVGTRLAWDGWRWDSDASGYVFPIDHFLFLAELKETGTDVSFQRPTLKRDLDLLLKVLAAKPSS